LPPRVSTQLYGPASGQISYETNLTTYSETDLRRSDVHRGHRGAATRRPCDSDDDDDDDIKSCVTLRCKLIRNGDRVTDKCTPCESIPI